MKDLPRFRRRDPEHVEAFIAHILTNKVDPRTTLRRLIERADHSFRAVFDPRFFVLSEGETEPSRSQWNNLKKKLKRAAPDAFIFKDHGREDCAPGKPGCYYIDFGYFAAYDAPKARPSGSGGWRPGSAPPRRRGDG
jgi:hypothetical protein